MHVCFRRGLSWSSRVILTVVSLHCTAYRSPAQHKIFDEGVIQKWKDYEDFARSLQGTAQSTSATRPGQPPIHISYIQNRTCALSINRGRDPSDEFYALTNPRYKAGIKGSKSDPGNVVLQKFEEIANAEPSEKNESNIDWIFHRISPHFSSNGSRLSLLVLKPSFKANKASKETVNGEELMRIDFTYDYDVPGTVQKHQRQTQGSLYLNPSRCWCIRRFKESSVGIVDGEKSYDAKLDVEYETIDHPSGFPIIKSKTESVNNYFYKVKKKLQGTTKIEYDLKVDDSVPDSEFTLTAFGLPEPGGEESVKKPIPLYMWILASAGVCAVLSWGFRYLLRRARLRQIA
jgi:hypothetical protein